MTAQMVTIMEIPEVVAPVIVLMIVFTSAAEPKPPYSSPLEMGIGGIAGVSASRLNAAK